MNTRKLMQIGLILLLSLTLLASAPDSLTDEEEDTLNSLERVDDYPLYTMHYYGSYDDSAFSESRVELPPTWACSLFAAFADSENKLYGRNFDWEFSPALLLFTDPPDGYASASMVDIAYLGFGSEDLTELSLEERQALLYTPFMPFDGMNERGLVIAMAAVSPGNMTPDPDKETIGSLGMMREILDHAATVDEALELITRYNIDFTDGPPLHYLIADVSGRALLVEFYKGEIVVTPNESSWHTATNFLRASVDDTEGKCWRHDILTEQFTQNQGRLTIEDALSLLDEVSQAGSTQWSIVYSMSTGEINVAMGEQYDQVHTFELELAEE